MSKNRVTSPMLTLLLLLLTAAIPASLAQETLGDLTGTITDPTGAVLVGAVVTATNTETDQSFTATTDDKGVYWIKQLLPGPYRVRVNMQGFQTKEVNNVIVQVGKTAQVSTTVQVGTVEGAVTVTETAALIDPSSTTVAHNVTAEEFVRLPKPRSFQGLAVLAPSVTTGELEAGYQINGASSAENNYYIDGVSTNSLINGSARQNAVFEFLREVQVKTNGIEAEYGGALGGVVSAITKSGGNDFHGEAHYYFYGNRIGSAPTQRLQLNPETEESFAYIQDAKNKRDSHEFGGSLGGPIVRNKAFFFVSASPRWQRAAYDYLFDNGASLDTIKRNGEQTNLFGKVNFIPNNFIHMNFSWLYTPQYVTGSLPVYDGYAPNVSVRSLESAQANKIRGYSQPEQSYSGQIDMFPGPASVLTIRGGRYYLDYKETGIPYQKYYWWQASSVGIPGVPEDLQQPLGYVTPSSAQILYDITTRTYASADYSHFFSFGGQHNIKVGVGVQKNVNSVYDSWVGPLGRMQLFWDLSVRGDRGTYGYYTVDDARTNGSTGATITHIYVQDHWRVMPRLTISAGLRTEREVIPSFRRDIQDKAFEFGFGDKLAPRIGAAFDVLGDGRMKLSGSWGLFYDWTKYDLARGTFGGDIWHVYYRSLDTTDIYNIDLTNLPGRNLWDGEFRDRRVPGFDYVDPNVKPMSASLMNIGLEYEIIPQTVVAARFNRNHLIRTIEDMGALDAQGNEVYRYGNPGEGTNTIAPVSGATCTVMLSNGACGFPMPTANRDYDALELSVNRRFTGGWLASASYVYSRLYGNYSGLQSTDEIRPDTLGYGFPVAQVFGSTDWRSGGNANRYFDLDEAMWDANGNVGLNGPLPTERPHVFKLYGSKDLPWGFQVGGFFRIMSGTPVTTQVVTINDIPFYVEGRGNAGRTPVFNQTDLMVAKEFSFGEVRKLRLEFNADNLFNQKTSMFTFDRFNREEHSDSAGIDLSSVDLSQGFDWRAAVAATPDGPAALDPRYGQAAIFNPGFQGRFLIKYIF